VRFDFRLSVMRSINTVFELRSIGNLSSLCLTRGKRLRARWLP
jgi:hypothetical protein